MRYIKLFEEELTHRQIVDNYKKNKPIEIPFVKELDEKTIRAESNTGWYVDFYFDYKGRLTAVDNPWDIITPDWFGFDVSIIAIKQWAKTKERYSNQKVDVYHIMDREAKKYNL